MKKNLLLALLLLLLSAAGAFAQLSSAEADYTDSTKYRPVIKVPNDTTRYLRQSPRQDKIFVFYEKHGRLEAKQPAGRPLHFTWYKLDTATLEFNKIWADTVKVDTVAGSTPFAREPYRFSRCALPPTDTTYGTNSGHRSQLPDSLGYGCYRVLTDTLQTVYDTLRCDSFCYDITPLYDTVHLSEDRDSIFIAAYDTLYVDTTLYIATRYNVVPADTFNAWIFIDTFRIDTIIKTAQDCDFLRLEPRFFPNGVGGDYYWYSWYTYLDLWQTPKRVQRDFPDCYDCFIKEVAWTTSVNIYEGVDVGDVDESWKTKYNADIPSPYYPARYTIKVSNYFGNFDTMSTGMIEAMATYAKMKLYVSKNENGAQDWEEKTDESGEESPAVVKLVNASINSNNGVSTFTWSLFANLYEQPEDVEVQDVPLIGQITTSDSAEAVLPADYDRTLYQPGRYPMALYVENAHGCSSSDTIFFEVDEFLLNKDAIPTVFTPNGDEKNDVFALKDPEANTQSLQSIEISIVNRNGQLMFSSSDVLFSWDGKMRSTNTTAPDGVYFYVLKATGLNKRRETVRQTYKGYLHVFNGK